MLNKNKEQIRKKRKTKGKFPKLSPEDKERIGYWKK